MSDLILALPLIVGVILLIAIIVIAVTGYEPSHITECRDKGGVTISNSRGSYCLDKKVLL